MKMFLLPCVIVTSVIIGGMIGLVILIIINNARND